jgi:hypothetical protein
MDRDELKKQIDGVIWCNTGGFNTLTDKIVELLARELEKARKYERIANLISAFPGKQKYPQIMEAINLLREIEGIVKEAT